MGAITTETETVIKKILPYLRRRNYDTEADLDFETPTRAPDRYSLGYADILVTCGKPKPQFIIEAKRSSKKLNTKDRDQAVNYGKSFDCLFVVVSNGKEIQCFNVADKKPILWDGKLTQKIPTKSQLPLVLRTLRANKYATEIALSEDPSLPFRPGLPLKQLNSMFSRCHNKIRKIEKDEENAFSDFSKLLFLKLLEEKADNSNFELPYSYRFYDLAERKESDSDQVQALVQDMIEKIRNRTPYGDVLEDPIKLGKSKTFRHIVRELAAVSFQDCNLDSKGAAFEYFVRATLKGKKLGQYFTPRPLIHLMSAFVGRDKILSTLLMGQRIKVFDPACGTGGFLVFLMQDNLRMLKEMLDQRKITQPIFEKISDQLKKEVFFGSDANLGVACAAKMNMIIVGDGSSNIRHEDSLAISAENWSMDYPNCDIILTNPPFGTSESESLSKEDLDKYDNPRTKGQLLFLQKMVECSGHPSEDSSSIVKNTDICTVIDEGVLNNEDAADVRRWLFKKCHLKAVIRLPDETFKPNKINVKASVLYLQRRDIDDDDFLDNYPVTFCDIESLGYEGDGEPIRGFDFNRMLDEAAKNILDTNIPIRRGYKWAAFNVDSKMILSDKTCRLDLKYWLPEIIQETERIKSDGGLTIKELNLIETTRGKSPDAELYVDRSDSYAYALVVKAGSNISKFGELVENGDYIEKNLYDELEAAHIFNGDVLLSSTGDGTLGKCCVYRSSTPAIADGHVTIIRPNIEKVNPEYLCDYLRAGFGHQQIERLFTGSTGLIELTVDCVNSIVVKLVGNPEKEQKDISNALREKEREYQRLIKDVEGALLDAKKDFEISTL